MKDRKQFIKNIVLLQGVIIIYTIASVMSKLASDNKDNLFKLVLFFGLDFVVLGIYAVLWQQMIKRFELSVAYANRSMAILWSMVWAVIFFHNTITLKNVLGIVLVFIGTLIVNSQSSEDGQV